MFDKKKQKIREKIKQIFLEFIQEVKIVDRVSTLEEKVTNLESRNKILEFTDTTSLRLSDDEYLSKINEIVAAGVLKLERRIHRLPVNLDYDTRILTHTDSGLRVLVDANDPHIAVHLIENGVWETHVQNCMAMFLTTGSVFVDVGANIGLHSLYAKQLIGCEGKLYCFEASKKTFKILSENIEMNGFLGVETYLYHNAVSSKNGQVEFHNFEHHAGMSSIKITKERLEKFSFDKGISETVDALTLDSVKNLRSAGKVDLVKIDVENFEYEVLLGMKEIIKSSPNIKIILEFLPYDIIEIHGQTYFKEMLKFMINNFSYIYEISQPNGGLKTVILNEENMHGYDLLLSKISCI